MRIVGLDIGERRIGVAVSDVTGTLARPLGVLRPAGLDVDALQLVAKEIARLAAEEDGVAAIVVGLPRRLDGTATDFGNDKSSAVVVGDGVALTTRRTRDLGDRGVSSTVWTDLYRVDVDRLTLVGRRTQTQSDGSLLYMPINPLVTIVYRRVP